MAPARSAYMLFTEEHRAAVTERLRADAADGKVPMTAIAKALGEAWKALADEEREAFRAKARQRAEADAAAAAEAGGADGAAEGAAEPAAPAPAGLPRHVVKRIMLADAEVSRVSADALWLVTEATAAFLGQLGARCAAAAAAKKRRTVKLEDFDSVVRRDRRLVEAGLKDVAANRGLFAGLPPAGAKKQQHAAAPRDGGGGGSQPAGDEQQQQQAPEQQEQRGEAEEALTDEQRIELEEARRAAAAEAAKARAARAAERKAAKAVEETKSNHKITTFFVSSRPDQA
ncbi:hypothetical protein HT031_001255 [Scenedesmus sp. PABB004]|nr:hypothetical protein HT031_001255 [Scenedesmus sp. PABB004]